MNQKIVFVYNAEGDWFNAITDFAHKLLSRSTYKCHLCTLTYGSVFMKQDWKQFIAALPAESEFIYKDQFERKYGVEAILPAIFITKDAGITELVSKAEIDSCLSLKELEDLLQIKLKSYAQYNHSDVQRS